MRVTIGGQLELTRYLNFPGDAVVKNLSTNAGDSDLISGPGRCPGEGNGNPLQCSCLGNPITEEPGGYNPWDNKELDTTEHTHTAQE